MTGMDTVPLRFKNVYFSYGQDIPDSIHDVSFELPTGSITVIIGGSGSGKSTLLRLAIALSTPTAGTIENTVHTRMVFQSGALLPWSTAQENVELGTTGMNLQEKQRDKITEQALKQVGIYHVRGSYPRELSGGQRQRVGIARALVSNPELLLLDEPFSALDVETSERLVEELLILHKKERMTMFMVSHSIEDAVILADTILVCADGRITRSLAVELARPRERNDQEVRSLITKIKGYLPKE